VRPRPARATAWCSIARIDVFLAGVLACSKRPQAELLPEALERAQAYLAAGADCVFPIALWERDPLADFIAQASGPVNVLKTPRAPSLTELAALGVARVSWGSLLHREAMGQLAGLLASLADG
jgi:2-methylisocitrate lyase-like PEP mutase family enzyme